MASSSSDQQDRPNAKLHYESPLATTSLTPSRKKKLLGISLGGILCHRVFRKDTSVYPINCRPDAAYGSYKVYRRPYSEDFVSFCMERFEVGIWSSAREWYTNNALDCVMGKLSSRLLFSWDQDKCTNTGFRRLNQKEKPIFLKELKKVWEMKPYNVQFSSSNTLLIDDAPYKAILNPPDTAIFPAEYKAYHADDNALGPNSELPTFLAGLAEAEDVPSYVKDHPIGKPTIMSTHSDWDFYSKIMRSIRTNYASFIEIRKWVVLLCKDA